MRTLLLVSLFGMLACAATLDAQTYKATYVTKLYLQGSASPVKPLTLEAPLLTTPYTLTFPANDGDPDQLLQTDGSGNLVWASAASALLPFGESMGDAGILMDITNTGTGAVAQFEISNASSTANALTAITNGTGLAILANGGVQVTNGNLSLTGTGAAGELRLHEESGGPDYTALKAQNQFGEDITYTMPATNGSAGQVLSVASSPAPTSTAATLHWTTPQGGLTLPYTQTVGAAAPLFTLRNSDAATGGAGLFAITNAANSGIALEAVTGGAGFAFSATATGSGGGASIQTGSTGTGAAGAFQNFNTANVSSTLQVSTNGVGDAFSVLTNGAGDAGSFAIGNAASNSAAVIGFTSGIGNAGRFQIGNAASGAAALVAQTDGAGPAFLTIGGAEITDGNLTVGNTGTAGQLRMEEPGGGEYTALVAQAQSDNITYTLPATNGSAGQALLLTGSPTATAGTLTWGNVTAALQLPLSQSTGASTTLFDLTNSGAGGAGSFEITGVGSSSAALKAGTSGVGPALYASTTGNGEAAEFENLNPANSAATVTVKSGGGFGDALYVSTSGYGEAGEFEIDNPVSSASALKAVTSGTGKAIEARGQVEISDGNLSLTNRGNTAGQVRLYEADGDGHDYTALVAQAQAGDITYTLPATNGSAGQALLLTGSPTATAGTLAWGNITAGALQLPLSQSASVATAMLDLTNSGAGSAGSFEITGVGSSSAALKAGTSGVGPALYASTTGNGEAAEFENLNPANSAATVTVKSGGGFGDALYVSTSGYGEAGEFEIDNPISTASALKAVTSGTGRAIEARGPVEISDGNLSLTNRGNTAGQVRLYEADGDGHSYVGLKAPALPGDVALTLPAGDGNNGDILVTDGSGVLSWAPPGATVVTTAPVTSGAQGTVTIGSGNYIRFSGATGAFSVDGFTGGVDGRVIYVYNTSAQNMTLNLNSAATASNGVNTLSALNVSTVGEGAFTLIYDAGISRWVLLNIIN